MSARRTARLHADRAAGRHRHHRHPDRPAAARRPEGPRGRRAACSARTTSSRSAWPSQVTAFSSSLPSSISSRCPARPIAGFPDAAGRRVSVAWLVVVVQREGLAGLQRLLALGELADPQLRSLEIGEDADRAADRLLHRADAADQRSHQFVVGMAHVDAEDVRASLEELLQHVLAGGCRADRGDYLDVAISSHGVVCPVPVASPSVAGSSVS